MPWTVAHRAPLSLGCSRQEYCSGSPFLCPENLTDPGIKPASPSLQEDTSRSELPGRPPGTGSQTGAVALRLGPLPWLREPPGGGRRGQQSRGGKSLSNLGPLLFRATAIEEAPGDSGGPPNGERRHSLHHKAARGFPKCVRLCLLWEHPQDCPLWGPTTAPSSDTGAV